LSFLIAESRIRLQEIGRAGRDGSPAFCHLFLDDADYLKLRSLAHRCASGRHIFVSFTLPSFGGSSGVGRDEKSQTLMLLLKVDLALPIRVEEQKDLEEDRG
jgi:hypothetical protein